jgi:hypothetical protein
MPFGYGSVVKGLDWKRLLDQDAEEGVESQ